MLVTLPFTLLLMDFWPLQRRELIRTGEQAIQQEDIGAERATNGSCVCMG